MDFLKDLHLEQLNGYSAALLFFAGFLAGGINSVAGGGGFITLPTLMLTGLDAKISNMTGSMAVWPGNITGFLSYRKEMKKVNQPLWLFMSLGVVGSIAGAWLLLNTSNEFFKSLLPWLLLVATLLFAFGETITRRLTKSADGSPKKLPLAFIVFLLLLIAVYGGYFGGGMGIMTLAVLTLLGMTDIHEMNALKTLLVTVINAVCNAIFVYKGLINWDRCLVMLAGCALGGYLAGHVAQKIERRKVKYFVIAVGASMTAYYFVHG